MASPTTSRRATTTATGSEGMVARSPGRDLRDFLSQMGLVAIGFGALGAIATLAVYGLQLAGWIS